MLAHPLLRHLAVSICLVLGAVLLTLLFWPLCQWYPAAFFLVAVLAAGWRWGPWQGIDTAAIALVPLLFFYRSAGGEAGATPWGEVAWRLGLFALAAGFACYLIHLCRNALTVVSRYHGTLAAIKDALIFTDDSGRVLQLHPVAESLTGCQSADAIGQPLEKIFKCFQGDNRQPYTVPIEKVVNEQTAVELPADLVLANDRGREFGIQGQVAPYRDDEGARGVVIVFRDVTQRQQEERACRRSEEQFRTLTGCAPVSLLFLDPQGRCLYVNSAWQSASGLSSEECQGDGWARGVHPDDRGRLVTEWQHALRAGREFTSECRLHSRTSRDEQRWLRLSSAPMLSERGQLLGHVGVFEDHDARHRAETSLHASENRFTAFMKNFPGLAFLKDAGGRYVYANDAYARAFEWEPGDCEGKTDEELLPKGEENPFCSHVEHVLEYQDDRESVEVLREKRSYLVHQFAVPTGETAQTWFGMLAVDITAQKESEQALRAARAEFESKWNERAGDLKRSEEAMKKARADLEKHLAECAGRQKQTEEALRSARQELEQQRRQADEHLAARRKSEEALKAATELLDEQAEEHKQSTHALQAQLDEQTLELEQMREHQTGHMEDAARREELEREIRTLTEKLAQIGREHAEELDRLAHDQDELMQENDSLQEQLAALRRECERLRTESTRIPASPSEAAFTAAAATEAETHQILVHSWRLVDGMETWRAREVPADWLSYN